MEHILLHLRRHQMRDVIATVQYLGASIRNYFGDGSEQGVSLTYSVEDSPLGTAGSVMLARQQLIEPFLVISDLANTGIYILDPAVFDFFRPGEPTDWSGDVFPKLLKQGEPVFGWVTSGYWEDVGNHAAYVKANFDCLEGRVKVDIPADRKSEGIW